MPDIACHAAQAVFYPMARKDDVVSHPVTQLKSGRDSDVSEPIISVIS